MEIKLINAAYQDKKQMKHAKTTRTPEGGGGGRRTGGAKFPTRLVTTFNVEIQRWRFPRTLRSLYEAAEDLGPALAPSADRGQRARKEKKGKRERKTRRD